MIGFLAKFFLGGGFNSLADRLADAYEAKVKAQTDEQKLAAEVDIQRIQAAIEMARVANQDRLSATSIGRYLIVVPFGLWYTLIFLVSIINPVFGTNFVILDIPPRIWEISLWLVPVIVAGEILPKMRLFK